MENNYIVKIDLQAKAGANLRDSMKDALLYAIENEVMVELRFNEEVYLINGAGVINDHISYNKVKK